MVCQRNVSVRTIWSYRDSTRLFLRFVGERAKKNPSQLLVADITEKAVMEFLTHLEGARHNSVQTRNHRLVAIRGLFNFIALQEPVLMEHCRRISAIPFKRQNDGNPLQTSCRGWNPSEIMLRRYRRQQADHATNGQRQNSTPHNRSEQVVRKGKRYRHIQTMPIGFRPVTLKTEVPSCECKACGKTFEVSPLCPALCEIHQTIEPICL